MIKYFLSLSLVLFCSFSFAQLTATIRWYNPGADYAGDTIYYNENKKLIWKDFKGRPDNSSMAAAITESGFGYRMSMQYLNGRTNIVITVFCYFNKRKSWVKRDMDTDYALVHEQHHFDITYINACLFIQKLNAARFTSTNYASLVDSIHDECYNAMNTMQDEYDGQTSNGRIKKNQFEWNKKIDSMLEGLTTGSR